MVSYLYTINEKVGIIIHHLFLPFRVLYCSISTDVVAQSCTVEVTEPAVVWIPCSLSKTTVISTRDGTLSFENLDGSLDIQATTANVVLDNIKGADIFVSTESGDIRAWLVQGCVSLKTISGNMLIKKAVASDLTLSSLYGNICCQAIYAKNTLISTAGAVVVGTVHGITHVQGGPADVHIGSCEGYIVVMHGTGSARLPLLEESVIESLPTSFATAGVNIHLSEQARSVYAQATTGPVFRYSYVYIYIYIYIQYTYAYVYISNPNFSYKIKPSKKIKALFFFSYYYLCFI